MGSVRINLSVWILLILLLCTTTSALTLNSISGRHSINGFRAANDSISFNVTSAYPTVKYETNEFDCSSGYCLLQLPIDEKDGGIATYTINEIDAGSIVGTLDAGIIVDESAKSISFDEEVILGNLSITYTAADDAYPGSNKCSGINKVELYIDDRLHLTDTTNTTPNTCSLTNTINIQESGSVTIKFLMYDNVDNVVASEQKTIFVDLTPPQLNTHKFTKQGVELGKISYTNEIKDVYFEFDLYEDSTPTVWGDFSALNENPILKNAYKHVPAICSLKQNSTTEWNCKAGPFNILLLNDSVTLFLNLQDSIPNEQTINLTHTFDLDTSIPQVTGLGTDKCLTEPKKCFISPTPTTAIIDLDDSEGNFETKDIYFTINSFTYRAENCTRSRCTATITNLECNHGQTVQLTASGRDDSGNQITGELSTALTCDQKAPGTTDKGINITFESGGEYGLVYSGSTLTIHALLEEIHGKVNASANLTQLNNNQIVEATCEKTENYLVDCAFTISSVEDGPYVARPTLHFQDTAGNILSKEIEVPVLELASDNQTPNLFTSSFIELTPPTINRIALQLAIDNSQLKSSGIHYPVYGKYRISKRSGNNPKILFSKVEDCSYIYENEQLPGTSLFSEVKIANPELNWNEGDNRLDFYFGSANTNQLDQEFDVLCNISLVVQEGEKFYSAPEIEKIRIPFELRNSRLGEPGQAFVDKIKEQEDNFWVDNPLLDNANKVLSTLSSICNIKNYLDTGETIGATLKVAAKGISEIPAPGAQEAAEGVNVPAEVSTQASAGAIAKGWYDDISGILTKVCQYATCSTADASTNSWIPSGDSMGAGFLNNMGQGSETYGWLSDPIFEDIDTPDPGNSIYIAAATKCLPAVIWNLQKYRQIECGYLDCLKDQSMQAHSTLPCDEAKSAKICKTVTGEVFEIFPYTRLAGNIADNVKVSAQTLVPTFLTSYVMSENGPCHEFSKPKVDYKTIEESSWKKITLCYVSKAIADTIDSKKRTKRAQSFVYPIVDDFCPMALCNSEECGRENPNLLGFELPDMSTLPVDIDIETFKTTEEAEKNFKVLEDYYAIRTQQIPEMGEDYREKFYVPDNEVYIRGISIGDGSIEGVDNPEEIAQARDNLITLGYTEEELQSQNILDTHQALGQATQTPEGEPDPTRVAPNLDIENQEQFEYSARAATNIQEMNNILAEYQTPGGQARARSTQFGPQYQRDMQRVKDIAAENNIQIPDDFDLLMGEGEEAVQTFNNNLATINTNTEEDLELREQQLRTYQKVKRSEAIGQGLSKLALFADSQGWLDIMYLEGWGNWGEKTSQWFDKYLNTDTWQQDLCNRHFVTDFDKGGGVYITDEQGFYDLVLTMASEKITINQTTTLYTVTYDVGGVSQDAQYNLIFKPGNKKAWDVDWIDLPAGTRQPLQNSFASPNDYNQICLKFKEDFPPGIEGRGKEFCRPILDMDQGQTAFNTGRPVPPETVDRLNIPGGEGDQGPGWSGDI
ncbi:hypothetical protein CMO92_01025 [Candidatus Woesearchaeota archaeon]|nr:hypothetical protein [Candidatus Woesearchaeota archaeon]